MISKTVKSKRIRVVLLESNRIAAQLFAHALKRDRFEIVYAGSSSIEAIAAASRDAAEVAIVSANLDMHHGNGSEVIRSLNSACPKIRIIALIDQATREPVLEAFRSGARGLFCRTEPLRALSKCIVAVHRGQLWASNAEMEYVLQAAVSPSSVRITDARGVQLLSKREQQVAAGVSEGLTNREIAERLNLSENTVKNYLFRIFDKLGISNRVELMMYAGSQAQQQAEPVPHDPCKTFEDVSTLFRWCQEAAERFVFAPLSLGEMYRDGRLSLKDKSTAYMWFLIAEHVNADLEARAQTALHELAFELTEKQLAEAKHKALEWLKKHEMPHAGSRGAKESAGNSTAA
jgi:DNA-binding NarL/FixJ family response regulator